MSVLERIVRMGEGRQLKRLQKVVTLTNSLSDSYEELTDDELRGVTDEFKERYEGGESLDSLMPEAFAAVREASRRTLGMRHFDVQLMGGAALHHGDIAEMKTGEGKTLVATLPAYLNALTGRGVHIVTVNDYLASYQSELMGRVFRFLGLETGCIMAGMTPEERREQYGADITYGTNNEFGFDYLRDNMALNKNQLVHRDFHFAIVDEVDSILIDEARTPLIISGPASGDNGKWYAEFARIAQQLVKDEDYEVEEKKRSVGMLEAGVAKVEEAVGIENLYDAQNTPLISFLNNALKAKELFLRDREYVVQGGEVKIVDEHTGRLMSGRRYSDGLHQAIESKEGVAVKAENQTYASVTLQNYFRLYDKLSGMTGTAQTEAAELSATYGLGVIPIPTNKPMVRDDRPDLVYKSEAAKFSAVIDDIVERQKTGQPVLVGTVSVEKSEALSKELRKRGILHNVLNAKQHEKEASFVAEAGRKGAVTIATNMAGRGTDIMLGGNPEFRAVEEMHSRGIDPQESPEEYEAVWNEVLEKAQADVATEHEEVLAAGGLYVLGTERHDSRRIDNQLRGRSGRQGDPGESRFYLSLEDSLMRRFQQGLVQNMMSSGAIPDDMPIESKMLSRSIASAQTQIEGQNAETRKNVLKYDDVMNKQRQVIYAERRRVLDGEDVHDQVDSFIDDVVGEYVRSAAAVGHPEDWDLEALWRDLHTVYPTSITREELIEEAGGQDKLSKAFLEREIVADARVQYAAVEERLGEELMRNVERQVLLQTIDGKWREHLYEMDYLKEGIGLRAMGQRDPLMEYQREGFYLFEAMSDSVKQQTLQVMYRVRKKEPGEEQAQAAPAVSADSAAATAQAGQARQTAPAAAATGSSTGGAVMLSGSSSTGTGGAGFQSSMGALSYSGPSEDGSAKVVRRGANGKGKAAPTGARKNESDGITFPGTARNADCPCGSGKKYKLCHGKNEK